MGVFDIFKKNNNKNVDMSINNVSPKSNNLILKYKSGTVCEVEFSTLQEVHLENGTTKMIQEAILTYTEPDGRFVQKTVILDPQVIKDEQGNAFYATKAYYEREAKSNMALIKGFFQKDQLDTIENGYIGHIGVDPRTGSYNRSYDRDLKAVYDEGLRNRKAMQKLTQEENFERQLKEQTQRIENIKPHYKDSHAKVLTKEDYEQIYGQR